MKSKLTKITLLVIILVLALTCVAACGKDKTYKVTVMDGETEVATFNVEPNGSLTREEILAKVTKEGYDFVGLYTDADLTEAFVYEDEIISEITLYAKYTQKQLYISVKSEEGASTPGRIEVRTGETYSVPTPTKEGYDFTYYTYENDEEEDVKFDQSGVYTFSTNTRLTAHWTKKIYTVNLHVGDEITEQKVAYGDKVTLVNPTMAGYTFVDWRLAGATAAFDKTTAISANLDLYARFTANTYKVSFDTVGGEALAQYTATYGEEYTLPTAVKTGYRFLGYKYNGVAFPMTGTYTVAGNIYLIADWEIEKYEVTFLDADGSEIAKQSNVAFGAKAQPIIIPGYDVEGYYLDAAFSADKRVTLADYAISGATTLYVNKIAKSYTLTVDGWHEATISVTYGETYRLVSPDDTENALYLAKVGTGADQEWATFTGYTYEGNAFPAAGTYTYQTNITVTPLYTANPNYEKATVTFWDTVANAAFKAVTVNRGESVDNELFPLTDKAGYTFDGWFVSESYAMDTAFTSMIAVNENIKVYAKYTANRYTLTIKDTDADGEVLSTIPVTFGEAVEIPSEIAKRGYTFTGYSETVASPYAVADDMTIFALYTRNTVTVTFLVDGETYREAATINQYQSLNDCLPESPEKTGYTFKWWSLTDGGAQADYAAEIEANAQVYAVFDANEYTITYEDHDLAVTYGVAYALPTDLTRYGYTFGGYRYQNAVFDAEGTYLIADSIEVEVVWTPVAGENFVKDEANGYFKERASAADPYTYVFLTGRTYDFSGYTLASTADGTLIDIVQNATKFNANIPGEFTLTATSANGSVANISAKIVYDVTSITLGVNYNNMITNAANSSSFQTTIAEEDYVMTAGIRDFRPELSILNNSLAAITSEEGNVEVTMENASGASLDAEYTLSGNSISFDGDAGYTAEEKITLTFKPKYVFGNKQESLTVKFNTGVNVYTNAELKLAYADTSVQCINVLRNIVAALDESDYESGYGTTGNIALETSSGTQYLENWDLGTPQNKYNGGVYRRTTTNQSDNLVVNGNYFSIDGRKLPYINTILNRTSGVGYDLGNVQIGIFLYRCADVSGIDEYDDVDRRYVGGNVTFNNLKIEGNNQKQFASATVKTDRNIPLIKMSTSFDGVVVRGGTVNMNNSTVMNVNLGFLLDGGVSGFFRPGLREGVFGQAQDGETQAVKLNLTNSMVANCWANSIYSFDLTAVSLVNTKLGSSSGAAIHFDDRAYAGNMDDSCGYTNLSSSLKMDIYSATNIQNWVAGTEPWFIAYNMSGAATTIKTDMENGVSGNGLTILKTFTGIEMMNFAICVNPTSDSDALWAGDNNGHVAIDTQIIDTGTGLVFFYGDGDANGNGYPDESETVGYYLQQYQTAVASSNPAAAQYFAQAVQSSQAFVSYLETGLNIHIFIPAYLKTA